jgi:pSer/pThr/pTyr-binding forkhead associated (FHA) protein
VKPISVKPIPETRGSGKEDPKTISIWGRLGKDRLEKEKKRKQEKEEKRKKAEAEKKRNETPIVADDPPFDSDFRDIPKEDTDTRVLQDVIRGADVNEEDLHTIRIDGGSKSNVTGWLVEISGQNIGKDYRIGDGKNRIGRGPDKLEIVITGDQSISRTHTVILYDATSTAFYLQPNEGDGMAYVNGELVLSPQKLKKGDRIKLGNTELYFVPFCGEDFSWNQVL